MNNKTVGIILAGGSATRLRPLSNAVCKQLMPVYDKPMIYYPLSTLMSAGIRDILIITTPHDNEQFVRLLGDGSQWGCSITYTIQDKPNGLAQALILGESFIRTNRVCLILGDNIFYGPGVERKLIKASKANDAVVFAYRVKDPERYGVVDFDQEGIALSIEEKPTEPKSSYAVPGIYFYDSAVVEICKAQQPSARGELEITDTNQTYLEQGKLTVQRFEDGTAWLDTGTFESMMQAANYVQTIEERQGIKIGCVEEIAFKNKWIDTKQLRTLAEPLMKSGYGEYLLGVLSKAEIENKRRKSFVGAERGVK